MRKYTLLCFIICIGWTSALEPNSQPDVSVKTAIVGAGLAGLTTAYTLKGEPGTHLFEARSRLGGRVHTVYFNEEQTSYFEEGEQLLTLITLILLSLPKRWVCHLKK